MIFVEFVEMYLQWVACLLCLAASTRVKGSRTPCTLDPQFTVDMTRFKESTAFEYKYYYDYTNKKIAVLKIDFTTNPPTILNRRVEDYNTGIDYMITPDGSCIQLNFGSSQPMLPPDFQNLANTSYLGTSYQGHPSNSLVYDKYHFTLGSRNITFFVSVPECVPIHEEFVGGFATIPFDVIVDFHGYQGSISSTDSAAVFNTSMC